MLNYRLETLPEYKQVCEHINPVYVDIIFSYLTEIILDEYDFIEIPYVNNKKHGVEKWYYKSGKIKMEIPYVNGKEHGIKKKYYESGQIRYEIPYVNGKIRGIQKIYYESGQIRKEYFV
jgi:hypothetical protein